MSGKSWILVGSLCAALSVIFGAFAAHALPGYLESHESDPQMVVKRLDNLNMGARYQMYHALGLVMIGLLQLHIPSRVGQLAAWCLLIGIILFSGSLYAYALTGIRKFGMITPLGGISYIVGWVVLAAAAWRSPSN